MLAFAAAALAVAVCASGLRWGALVAGGADSYGYVSQAGLWAQGLPIVVQDIVRPSPWPFAAETWAPLGWRPSPSTRGAIVPLYAPGLPLLMALGHGIAGYCGAFLVVPLCGGLTIWLTFSLGRRLLGAPGVALWGAALVATSPVFLYQVMNAMSDVPVTAAWTLALVLAVMRRPLASGLAMSVAIAIRPNLAPLAAVLFVWMATGSGFNVRAPAARENRDLNPKDALWFAMGVAPSIAGIAWLNATLYESVLTSGYGTTGSYYSLGYAATNARQFGWWLIDTETPLVALAALYFAAPRLFPAPAVPRARFLVGGSMAVVVLSYLFYRPFDVWWYLRFLLPMWPVMMLLTAAAIDALARLWAKHMYPAVIVAMVVGLAWHGLAVAASRSAFALGSGERRYIDVGRFVAGHTPDGAVMISLQHSGSLRLYGGRLTLRYDVLDPGWLDRTVDYLRSIGRRPFFVLDGPEVEAFRRRFAASNRTGVLDWPPMATLGTTVAIYDPSERKADTMPLAIARTRGRGFWRCDPPQAWPPSLRMR
jgi:hypothetical protein